MWRCAGGARPTVAGAEWGQALVCHCLCLGSVAQLGFRYLKVSFPGERRAFLS